MGRFSLLQASRSGNAGAPTSDAYSYKVRVLVLVDWGRVGKPGACPKPVLDYRSLGRFLSASEEVRADVGQSGPV